MRRIVGVDLSMTNTGLAEVNVSTEGFAYSDSTSFRSSPASDKIADRHLRLHGIVSVVCGHVDSLSPDLVLIEGPSYGSKGGSQHDRSGLWWLTVSRLLQRHSVVEASPASVKKFATGKGTAGKGAVIEAVTRRWPEVATGGDDNRVDALVLAMLGAYHLMGEALPPMPKAHLSALDGVHW